MPVRTGMGRTSIARSVTMFTGAKHRNSVTIDVHVPKTFDVYAAMTGWHLKAFRKVNTIPAILTTPNVAKDAFRSIFCVFLDNRRKKMRMEVFVAIKAGLYRIVKVYSD